jgi:anti-sigma B factor antagonist
MEFNVTKTDGRVNVKIIGPVDWLHTENLDFELSQLLLRDFNEVVLNLSLVPFITSSAIGKLLVFYKTAKAEGKKIRIKGINHNVLNLFKTIKIDQLFPMEI